MTLYAIENGVPVELADVFYFDGEYRHLKEIWQWTGTEYVLLHEGRPTPPAFVGASGGQVTGAGLTINYPAGSNVGDLLVCMATFLNNTATAFTVASPAGWNILANTTYTGNTASKTVVMWRFRGVETSVTLNASTSASIMTGAGDIIAYKGDTVNPSAPVAVWAAGPESPVANPTGIPVVTTPVPNCALAMFVQTMTASVNPYGSAWSGTATERTDDSIAFSTFARYQHSSATDVALVSGPTPAYQVTGSAPTGLSYHEYAGIVAVQP